MSVLYQHKMKDLQPSNVNVIHDLEVQFGSFNQKLAVWLTRSVGSMPCAYLFFALAVAGFPGLLGPGISQYIQWISQTCIQLVMLSVIMVGQGVLGRKQELQSDEQYSFTVKSYHDVEQIMRHLDAQDEKIIEILSRLERNV